MAQTRQSPSSGTTLRQRRSKSPSRVCKISTSNSSTESESEPFLDDQETPEPTKKPTTSTTQLFQKLFSWPWLIPIAGIGLFAFLGLVFCAIWIPRLTGLYNPDPECDIPAFEYPDCSNALMHVGEVDPPFTSEQWLKWRELYDTAMTQAGRGTPSSLAEDWREPNTVGFTDTESIEFRILPGRGRSVVATKPIPKGTKIWDSRYRAVFPNDCAARHFMNALEDSQKCSAMFWGYINNFYGNGMQYMLDLDGHGYINHDEDNFNAAHRFEGELEKERYALSRLRIPSLDIYPLSKEDWKRRNQPGSYGLYAVRDIEAGEEILYNYEEIYMLGWIDWFTMYIERSLPVWEWFTL